MKTSRRDALKLAAVMPLASLHAQPAAPTPAFFTAEEFRLVDELTEMIIPADEHSPGARGAKVAQYIDQRLAESFDKEPQQLWRDGLRHIEQTCQLQHGTRFLSATPAQRVAQLTAMVSDDDEPKTLESRFFQELKNRTVHAYYTSDIGIHQEMEYKGNSYLDQFVGYDAK
jgi:gluconate 2-dehydrogenase gamma chain